jgi:putative hydrolase of HD superfamily
MERRYVSGTLYRVKPLCNAPYTRCKNGNNINLLRGRIMLKDEKNNNFIKNQNSYNKYKSIIDNDILKLYYQYTHLKNIYRQGWLTSLLGMEYENKVESVADHSWSVTMLAMSIIEKYNLDLDMEKCMKLAMVHELGEIYAGDFIPNQVTKEQKHKLEERAVDELLNSVEFDNDFKELWLEYENKRSPEADFIKQVDKLECILQAGSYGLNSKYIKGAESITLPCLKEILEDVYKITEDNELPLCFREDNER